jgi:hypothetical protein
MFHPLYGPLISMTYVPISNGRVQCKNWCNFSTKTAYLGFQKIHTPQLARWPRRATLTSYQLVLSSVAVVTSAATFES